MKLIAMGAAIILLAACGQPEPTTTERVERVSNIPLVPTEAQIDYADLAEPSDAALAELYNRSCISCHSVDGAGAPLTGHTEEWERRLSIRGMSGLLESTVNGRGAMTAKGMCMDCTDEDFLALINYMAEAE